MPFTDHDDLELAAEGQPFWTRESLDQVIDRVLGRRHFIVVSNARRQLEAA